MAVGVGEETASATRPTVFISYASQDAAVANVVVGALERAGLACWIAPREVVPGSLYADEIVRAINKCSLVVLVLSAQSVASPHVGKELERASSKRRRIIALRTDAAVLPHAFEYFLSESQWIEVGAGGIEPAATKLAEAVRHHLGSDLESSVDDSRTVAAAKKTTVTTDSPMERVPSIAVLPFANMSGDKEQEYFSDGLAEEIINALVQMSGLRVIARTSAFAFKGQNTDIRRIAETLGVAHILEGSVRRSGSRIRVTAQLISASDGSHLWSERFDREMADVFAVQDEISAAISDALKVKLWPQAAAKLRYTPTLPAYEALLKARHFHWKITAEAMEHSGLYYEQAIALDPQFALAHAEYAEYLMARAYLDLSHQSEMAPRSRAEARKALTLDPSLTDAHGSLCGVAASHDRDWKEAHRQFLCAIPEGRGSPLSRLICAWGYLLPSGRANEAAEQLQLAVQQDPLHVTCRALLGVCLDAAGRHAEAESILLHTRDLAQEAAMPALYLTYHYFCRNRLAEALALAEMLYSSAPWFLQGVGTYAGLLNRTGQAARGQEVLQRLELGCPGASTHMATYYLFCDELDQAADWFEKALENRDANVTAALQMETAKGLRASARWRSLAALANLPEAATLATPFASG